MKQKLSTEENVVEEIKYEMVENWFAKKLDPYTSTGTVIFDRYY